MYPVTISPMVEGDENVKVRSENQNNSAMQQEQEKLFV